MSRRWDVDAWSEAAAAAGADDPGAEGSVAIEDGVADGVGAIVDRPRKTLPIGPDKMAGSSKRSPTSAVESIVIIRKPNCCVGVNVLVENTARPKPAMIVVCVIAVPHRS